MKSLFLILSLIAFLSPSVAAEDGYRLWLRYDPLPKEKVEVYRPRATSIIAPGDSATLEAIRGELTNGCSGLLGGSVPLAEKIERDGAIVVGTPKSSPLIAGLKWDRQLAALGPEGFRISSLKIGPHSVIVIASAGEVGALYGAFHFLRLMQTLQPIDKLDVSQKPRLQRRMLNHWDNLDGSVERGYAGRSLWDWQSLPEKVDPRLRDYARANASIGVNGTAINNVNANSRSLSPEYLRKAAAVADVFRPYGLRVYLSARFSAPIELGGLKTADPFDPAVAEWWKKKADEIYSIIPDFGGFLVKANSEGQPGPRTYNRNHVDGANMLAAAVAPHDGMIVWRAFVYVM
jgi:alpha-glucuronidase